jgi:hypothetical protein
MCAAVSAARQRLEKFRQPLRCPVADLVTFQTTFLRMNHQIDVIEWSAFDQNDSPCLELGIPFLCIATVELTPTFGSFVHPLDYQFTDLVAFQTTCLIMNHQNTVVGCGRHSTKMTVHAQNGHSRYVLRRVCRYLCEGNRRLLAISW